MHTRKLMGMDDRELPSQLYQSLRDIILTKYSSSYSFISRGNLGIHHLSIDQLLEVTSTLIDDIVYSSNDDRDNAIKCLLYIIQEIYNVHNVKEVILSIVNNLLEGISGVYII
eukprot:TRINITY_DN7871_c0_g1_i3.p1 TRINITY_DN7871_c0_g1~~TRINITY_DN7871_c0_g1_i3.p1  ORF type:complete len:113 (-),score=13.69 TRINITY_DN7871_c0_g1_i3:373-711(-)